MAHTVSVSNADPAVKRTADLLEHYCLGFTRLTKSSLWEVIFPESCLNCCAHLRVSNKVEQFQVFLFPRLDAFALVSGNDFRKAHWEIGNGYSISVT